MSQVISIGNAHLYNGDALSNYTNWPSPTVIISDGPYGVNGFPGDLKSPKGLASWYEPHIEAWSKLASPQTTLWFWNTEIGWATVHPILEKYGWKYVSCSIWDKGLSHIAGNTNSKTIRHFPIVTEVCVQYVKLPKFYIDQQEADMKDWLRSEWGRTKLPFSKTNEACGVKNAATRKYFTKCHLWYMPPADAFEKIQLYANQYGDPAGKPYFSLDGITPLSKEQWEKMRAKFYCPHGITNVWHEPQLRNSERLKKGTKAIHLNQKPLKLVNILVESSSDPGDIVWDPFSGTGTTAVSCLSLGRQCYCSEIDRNIFDYSAERVESLFNSSKTAPSTTS